MDRLESGNPPLTEFAEAREAWLRKPAARHEAWIRAVLSGLCQWDDFLVTGTEVPNRLTVGVPEHGVSLRPWGALFAPKADRQADTPLVLVHQVPPGTPLRSVPDDGWAASPVDRLAVALRRSGVPIGVVTDGRWWALVWATAGSATGSGLFDAATWGEEPLLRDAFVGLLGIRRLVGVREEERLPALFAASLLAQEEITEALGREVRRAVELLVQAFSEARLEARRAGTEDPLPESPREVYEAAVTVLMRIVFLLFAEERGLLPIDRDLYRNSYAVSVLLDKLEERAREGEQLLDDSTRAWHRFLAVSRALHDGASFEDVRMPAYGGSLFRSTRFPWLVATDESGGLRLRVSDRVVLHLLRAVQIVTTAGQARRVSFREVDVEQIGYVYEGLLGYTARDTGDQVVLGLKGRQGDEPEIDLDHLEQVAEDAATPDSFADALLKALESTQPGSKAQTKNRIAKAFAGEVDESEVRSGLAAVCQHDESLVQRVLPFVPLLRRDLRGLPYVVPSRGLVVAETASRRNAGAHYTPRALAEEVVLHALEPLVYSPGPLQTADRDAWRLKGSGEILDLKVVDFAAGSGAFLVAAARYLAARLVEAWREEEAVPGVVAHGADRVDDPLTRLAIREVIARCLYGADINEMAVEMCKLSLWLVSLDPDKPFTFVDDKILLGNSLLGVTSVDQLRGLHIAPTPQRLRDPGFAIDVEPELDKAARLRQEIASSPVDDLDPQRSAGHKEALLRKTQHVTARLRDVADGVVAAGLSVGGRPGRALDAAYEELSLALLRAYPPDGTEGDRRLLDAIIDQGLSPTVETDYDRWQPLHWIVEVPDVMEHGGFDAVIGNPPFLGAKRISPALGVEQREWLVNVIARGATGNADLVAYFFRRADSLLSASGQIGLLATNTLAQGDSREVGLQPLVDQAGFTIRRAIRSAPWPSRSAVLEFAAVWASRHPLGDHAVREADGVRANEINTRLEVAGAAKGEPRQLASTDIQALQGSIPLGTGFLVTPELALDWIAQDSRNEQVLRPFLTGEDANSQPESLARRWAIDFGEMPESQARAFRLPWNHVQTHVYPERAMKDAERYPRMVKEWWKYWNSRRKLYSLIDALEKVVVIARTSNTAQPVLVGARQVFADSLVVFTTSDPAILALLASTPHVLWATTWGGTMRTDFAYRPQAVWRTFPRPTLSSDLRRLGEELVLTRREAMIELGLGLTPLYRALNSPDRNVSQAVLALRAAHAKVDAEVGRCYGWDDLAIDHGFFEFRGTTRFSVDPHVRQEFLDRLLRENHRRADNARNAL
jgi:hypothetical protein